MAVRAGLSKAYSKRVQPVINTCQYVQQSTGVDASFTELATFPVWSLQQKAALWAQIRKVHKNADMRELIEAKKYIDPFKQPARILQNEWVALVQSEILGRLGKVRAGFICL